MVIDVHPGKIVETTQQATAEVTSNKLIIAFKASKQVFFSMNENTSKQVFFFTIKENKTFSSPLRYDGIHAVMLGLVILSCYVLISVSWQIVICDN